MADYEASLQWRGSEEVANNLKNAIEADDSEFMTISIDKLENNEVLLTITTSGESIGSLRSTIDDLLVCLLASESALMFDELND